MFSLTAENGGEKMKKPLVALGIAAVAAKVVKDVATFDKRIELSKSISILPSPIDPIIAAIKAKKSP